MPDNHGFTIPDELRQRLKGVRRIGVITGAGISADSGIETYRGRGGIYDDPELGDSTIAALSGVTIQTQPDLTWRTVAKLALASARATPNAAHVALAKLEACADAMCILTQNVDGLHKAAGSQAVIDIHGDAFDVLCRACGFQARQDLRGMEACLSAAPRCQCGSVLRPDVVLFGEMLPSHKLEAIDAFFYRGKPDLVMSVGTTGLFGYISRPLYAARSQGILTLDVNPEETLLSQVAEFHVCERAVIAIPAIVDAITTALA